MRVYGGTGDSEVSECQFPNFRERFWAPAVWAAIGPSGETVFEEADGSMEAAVRRPTARQHRLSLKSLDLRLLPRDEAPPSELQIRREKFAYFEKRCSEVSEGLFLGAEAVAKNRETLRDHNITHVVNCVGFIYPEYFKDEIKYLTLRLQDTPAEDISSVLYDVFDFIQEARSSGGNVFVHCSQGVSRSATLVIAFLMWRLDKPYDEIFAEVKAIRGVANPNIGFTCQLLQWHKRLQQEQFCRVYRIGPHSPADPLYLIPKLLSGAAPTTLDPRGAFILHSPSALYIWQGSRCPPAMVQAAERAARHLAQYERAPWPPTPLRAGDESQEFWHALRESEEPCDSGSPSEVPAYSQDFDTYYNAAISSADPLHRAALVSTPNSPAASGPSGINLGSPAPGSPNERCRKYRRSVNGDDGQRVQITNLGQGPIAQQMQALTALPTVPSPLSRTSSPASVMQPPQAGTPVVRMRHGATASPRGPMTGSSLGGRGDP